MYIYLSIDRSIDLNTILDVSLLKWTTRISTELWCISPNCGKVHKGISQPAIINQYQPHLSSNDLNRLVIWSLVVNRYLDVHRTWLLVTGDIHLSWFIHLTGPWLHISSWIDRRVTAVWSHPPSRIFGTLGSEQLLDVSPTIVEVSLTSMGKTC